MALYPNYALKPCCLCRGLRYEILLFIKLTQNGLNWCVCGFSLFMLVRPIMVSIANVEGMHYEENSVVVLNKCCM